MCEERDASGAVAKKFFGWGQTISGSNYFYDFDHLGSIRDMTDSSGVVQAHYEFDLYGQRTKTAGALDSDFQYAGYYMHAPSGLSLTVYRAYNPSQGRWINSDPLGMKGGINLFCYAKNAPSNFIDPLGTDSGTMSLGGFGGRAITLNPTAVVIVASTAVMAVSVAGIVDAIGRIDKNIEQIRMNGCVQRAVLKWNDCASDSASCYPDDPTGRQMSIWDCDDDLRRDLEDCQRRYPRSRIIIFPL